jgi:hypothetical protein
MGGGRIGGWAPTRLSPASSRPACTPGVRTRPITLVTTLVDGANDRVADLAELYPQRWRVDTARAQLNTSRQMDVLHGQTGPGVVQECTVVAIVDTLVRRVMGPSALLHHRGVERISLLAALRWLGAPSIGIP